VPESPAIELTRVGVAYRLPRLGQPTIKGLPARLLRPARTERLWALRDVSLTVSRGEAVAVVGANGAGKSTLMRLLAGIFRPSEGRVVVRGSVAPLMDLGSGLDLQATGLENVVLYGALLRRPPRELRRKAPAVLEWAGLSAFADAPVSAYSSGMVARLAFSIAVATTPQVLLVDEVLAVGDAEFQKRSTERVRGLVRSGCAVVIVSHALDQLRELASRAVWLDSGRIRAEGPPDRVFSEYLATAAAR
jgi:ABC-2 type transport system ATP-binding protein/lipopolysaccharide transport system ATP-binding protein